MKKPDLRIRKPGYIYIMKAAGILHANFDDFVSYFCYSGYDSLVCDATCVFLPKLDMLPPETRHFEGAFSLTIRGGFESGKRVPLALLTLLVLSLSIIGWLLYPSRFAEKSACDDVLPGEGLLRFG